MENIINMENIIELDKNELMSINGGQKEPLSQGSSFGQDVGYICGWIIGAMCKGAAAIKG